MKKLTLIFGLLICSLGFAQDKIVHGSVIDGATDAGPLAFANVTVKGLDISAETSLDGKFQLNLLEGNYTLIIDFIGYKEVEIDNVVVDGRDVELNPIVLNALKTGFDLASTAGGE